METFKCFAANLFGLKQRRQTITKQGVESLGQRMLGTKYRRDREAYTAYGLLAVALITAKFQEAGISRAAQYGALHGPLKPN